MADIAGRIQNRMHLPLAASAAVISLVIVLNDNVRRFGQFFLPGALSTLIRFVLYAVLLYAAFCFLNREADRATDAGNVATDRTAWLKMAGLFFAVYVVFLLIFYPGVMYWDTMRQINDFFDGYTTAPYFAVYDTEISAFLNDHDGAFDTVLFGLFISIGNLFHSPNIGMFLYCLIQAALFSLLFSRIVLEIRRAGCPKWVCFAATVFYLHPFVCFYAVMMLKDVLFALCFLPYYLVFVKQADGGAERKNTILLIVLSLLCALTKKPGVYIVALSNAVLLLFYLPGMRRKNGGPEQKSTGKPAIAGTALSVIAPVLLVLVLFPKVVFPALQIYPGGREEAISVCLQTTVELIVEDEESLSAQDREVINKVMHYDKLKESYLSHTTDWAKYYFRSDATSEDLREYFRFWIRKGLRHPLRYLRTVAAVNGGFFAPDKPMELYISANAITPDDDYPGLGNLPATLTMREDLVRLYEVLSVTPPFSFFFYNVLYTWIIPAGCAVLLLVRHKKRRLLYLVPVLLSVLVLIAGPESTTRFAVHIIFQAPYLFALPFMKRTRDAEGAAT